MFATDGSSTPPTVPAYTPPGGVAVGVGSSVGAGVDVGLGDAAAVPWLVVPGVALGGEVEHAARSAPASSSVVTALPHLVT